MKKSNILILLLLLVTVSSIIFSFTIYEKNRKIRMEIDSSVTMYTAHVSDAFRRFEHNEFLLEGLYYLNAYASFSENKDYYEVSSRLMHNYLTEENFNKLNYEDTVYIADFLKSMNAKPPPSSEEVLKFLNFIVQIDKEE